REAELFAVPFDPPPEGRGPVPVRSIGRLEGFTEPATGADLSEDGTLLAVCSYAVTRVYRRGETPSWKLVAQGRYPPLPVPGTGSRGPVAPGAWRREARGGCSACASRPGGPPPRKKPAPDQRRTDDRGQRRRDRGRRGDRPVDRLCPGARGTPPDGAGPPRAGP